MDVGKAIFYILSNDATVAPLVRQGTSPSYTYRIMPAVMAQNQSAPFITYQRISTSPNETKDGPSELDAIRFQLNIVAAYGKYGDCQTLAEATRVALDRVTPATYSGINVHCVDFASQRDDFTIDAKLEGVHMITQDYIFWIYR